MLFNGIEGIYDIRLGVSVAEVRCPRSVTLKADGIRLLLHDVGFAATVSRFSAVQSFRYAILRLDVLALYIPGVQTPACALSACSRASGSFLPRFSARFSIP